MNCSKIYINKINFILTLRVCVMVTSKSEYFNLNFIRSGISPPAPSWTLDRVVVVISRSMVGLRQSLSLVEREYSLIILPTMDLMRDLIRWIVGSCKQDFNFE